MHTLLIPLIGPMQSWGHRSRFDDRDTGLEPTRSGVIGMICAAMGIARDGDLSRFNKLRMGVRVDAPGRVMVDYHTAKDVMKANGEVDRKNAVTSQRHYLSDARFLVGLESNDMSLLEDIEDGLQHPIWPLFLGRKSFVPSVPVYLHDGSIKTNIELEQALDEYPFRYLQKWEKKIREPLRVVLETARADFGDLTRNDVPLSFDKRDFGLRQVRTDWIEADKLKDGGVWLCTSPNS